MVTGFIQVLVLTVSGFQVVLQKLKAARKFTDKWWGEKPEHLN